MLPKFFCQLYFYCVLLLLPACEVISDGTDQISRTLGIVPSGADEVSPEAYKRVITLDQGMTDLMYGAGAGGYIVGLSSEERDGMFPDSVSRVGVSPLDIEAIRKLNPDWIIGTQGSESSDSAAKLKDLGFNVRLFSFRNWQDISRTMQELGTYFGTDFRARNATDTLTAQWRSIRSLISVGRPSALFMTGEKALQGYGKESHLNTLIEDAGGYSLTSKLSGGKQVLKPSFITNAPADFMIITPDVAKSLHELIQKHPYIAQTRAYKRKKIYLIASELTIHPSPRYIEGAKEFAQIFFTDLFTPLQ